MRDHAPCLEQRQLRLSRLRGRLGRADRIVLNPARGIHCRNNTRIRSHRRLTEALHSQARHQRRHPCGLQHADERGHRAVPRRPQAVATGAPGGLVALRAERFGEHRQRGVAPSPPW